MLKPKCFIIVMILSLPLQTKGITYCPCPVPWGAIKEQQEEQERRNRREQLNKLLNEQIEQGEMIEITTDKNVKLLIKQRKMVDTTVVDRELSLTEYILGAVGICMVMCLPLLAIIIIEKFG